MALRRVFNPAILPARMYCTPGVSALQNGEESGIPRDRLFSKLEIELRGIDPAVLKSYSWFATTAATHLGVDIGQW